MHPSRRQVLHVGLVGLAAFGTASLFSCAGPRRMATAPRFPDTAGSCPLSPSHYALLRAASLAPSGHNSQPWRVVLESPSIWRLEFDSTRALPAVDPSHRESLLSLGAFLENLTQAAPAYGFTTRVEPIFSSSSLAVARIHLQEGDGATDGQTLARIQQRRTLKNGLLRKEIRSDDLRVLTQLSQAHMEYVPYSSPQGKRLEECVIEGMSEQCARNKAMEELAQWIRFSSDEAKTKRDGLSTEGMEITGFAGWVVRHFYHKSDVTTESFIQQTLDKTAQQARSGGGFLLLCADDETPESLVNCGRQFQRLFLQVRERNLGLHPMSAALEESQARQRVASLFESRNGSADGPPVQFILRVGYAEDYPPPVSFRRPPEQFVWG